MYNPDSPVGCCNDVVLAPIVAMRATQAVFQSALRLPNDDIAVSYAVGVVFTLGVDHSDCDPDELELYHLPRVWSMN